MSRDTSRGALEVFPRTKSEKEFPKQFMEIFLRGKIHEEISKRHLWENFEEHSREVFEGFSKSIR